MVCTLVKDAVFGEDDAPFPAHNPATNWSIIRSFVLNLLRRHGYQAISQVLRLLRHNLDALISSADNELALGEQGG